MPLDEPTVAISGQVYLRYLSVDLGTYPHPTIADQIIDHYAPYCDELTYTVCNENIVLPD